VQQQKNVKISTATTEMATKNNQKNEVEKRTDKKGYHRQSD
jgi:hypothetical protein